MRFLKYLMCLTLICQSAGANSDAVESAIALSQDERESELLYFKHKVQEAIEVVENAEIELLIAKNDAGFTETAQDFNKNLAIVSATAAGSAILLIFSVYFSVKGLKLGRDGAFIGGFVNAISAYSLRYSLPSTVLFGVISTAFDLFEADDIKLAEAKLAEAKSRLKVLKKQLELVQVK